ncbi:alpha/beta hydrolase [Herbiconiux sp. CPCC 205763]|uniref:Alpha/beta hydrolase n=1 Tax=Herbiconiux aconitum TaxID=2970913 RepID=A0ABT2GQQ5_9MICO|nr:alpha/beta hydrolase [Herbiconiux aconitum]MCS5718557.1 alpha/beta hydrolase [Herbiconiux aconitum]
MEHAINPTDGARIAYRVTPPGPEAAPDATPILLVHGTALSQAIWRGFGYLRALSPERTVITLDLRGHGRSDTPHHQPAYGMELFTGDVVAVLDTLGLDRVHYLGYSLGARVGFSLAVSHPHRLRSLISIAGAPGTGQGAFDRVFFPGALDELERGGMAGFLTGWEEASGQPVDAVTRAAFSANDEVALAAYMRETQREGRVTDAQLAAFAMPLLLVAGTRDPERLRAAEHVKSVLPAAEILVVDGATHGATPRHPEVLPALRDFLARTERRTIAPVAD